MHFAYGQQRKGSQPSPYAIRSRPYWLRVRRGPGQLIALIVGCVFTFWLVSRWTGSSSSERIPPGTPPVVLVTTIDPDYKESFVKILTKNRKDYAAKHGYATFFPSTQDYPLDEAPRSWARVPAIRHAMTEFPHSTYFFHLDAHALIANYDLSVEEHIMNKDRLEKIMIVNIPVVPPDSVIKTFAHLKGDRIDLVLTQDKDGLSQNSMIIRRGEWAKYFLDAWFDPLYRSYNFQKAEGHALEHIVQWHGTILAKLALVEQNIMNSYIKGSGKNAAKDGTYSNGHFIVNFGDCDKGSRSCETEMDPFLEKVKKHRRSDDE
ncbi:glycosyltransferase family 34 protein [Aulographum hederae CBS 113979]|uniref:Glycosyltransferase family 34 protein n=1 Tax=Aulographum hederae CBS 113979 TaxID=1176131 RepID=A0A6G1H7L6_9PEZI|nr:glycosyltransferase family 34 protein [Aulographum hederae CBS 113979]